MRREGRDEGKRNKITGDRRRKRKRKIRRRV
jgi:hypothetical protein